MSESELPGNGPLESETLLAEPGAGKPGDAAAPTVMAEATPDQRAMLTAVQNARDLPPGIHEIACVGWCNKQ